MTQRKEGTQPPFSGKRVICLGVGPEVDTDHRVHNIGQAFLTFIVVQSPRDLSLAIAEGLPCAILMLGTEMERWISLAQIAKRLIPDLPLILVGKSVKNPPAIVDACLSAPNQLAAWLNDPGNTPYEFRERRMLQQTREVKIALTHEWNRAGRIHHPDFVRFRWQIVNILEKLVAVEESLELIRKKDALTKDTFDQRYNSV
ncbi:MAG: hypothetical protein AAFV07_11715 [Bacteroidota bacterium]